MTELPKPSFCARFHRAAELLGRRWNGAIVQALLQGVTRFNQLEEAIPGISARMLTERLRELETEGIVVRQVTGNAPVRISYELSYKGRDLARVVDAITEWAHDWVDPEPSDPVDHAHPHARRPARK